MRKFVLGLIGLMGLIGLVGCKTVKETVEVPVYIHDTTQTVRELHDSIYIDRFREVTKKNDTIYITDSIAVIKYSLITDTAYRYIERPVTVTRTEQVEVKKPLAWWQKGLMWIGVVGLMGLIGLIGWRILKRKFLPRA